MKKKKKMMMMKKKKKEERNEEDQLIQLPDGILSTIVSFLTLKDAVRTSILSKNWRFIWTFHSHLSFNPIPPPHHHPLLLQQQTTTTSVEVEVFVQRLNQLMLRRLEGPKIDSLSIRFHLSIDSTPHIHHWLRSALIKGVETIDLDLSPSWSSCSSSSTTTTTTTSLMSDDHQYYQFPCSSSFLEPEVAPHHHHHHHHQRNRKCTLKHLRLASCTLNPPPPPNLNTSTTLFTSLTTIVLQQVPITDQHLNNLLSHSSLLQSLTLHLCKHLFHLSFSSGLAPNLNFLNISACSSLQKIHLSAQNLVTFEYTGHLLIFSFSNVPKLATAFLSFTGHTRLDGVTYALTRFPTDLPQLDTLHLLSVLAIKTIDLKENGRIFTNIKQLALTIFPFDDEDKLCWISYILKAFPLLQKLQLNLFAPSYIKQPKEIERLLPECPHKHLTEVEINGFYGNQHEVDLLKYLLDNLKALEELVVSSCQKVYKGDKNWAYEEASSQYKPRLKSVLEWLHALVPPTVHLEIR